MYNFLSKVFRRVPFVVWLILITLSFILIGYWISNYINDNNILKLKPPNEYTDQGKISIITGIVSVIGLLLVAWQIQSQTEDNILANEFLNQPNFIINDFGNKEIKSTGDLDLINRNPKKCGSSNCPKLHWFNLSFEGKVHIEDVKVFLFHADEDIDLQKSLRVNSDHKILSNGNILQYSLYDKEISEKYINSDDSYFYILLEYKSPYKKIKYKKVFQLGYSINPTLSNNSVEQKDWKSIYFYSYSIIRAKNSYSLNLSEIFYNFVEKICLFLHIKEYPKHNNIDKWLIDL